MAIFGSDIPFAQHCGIEDTGVADGRTQLRMVARPELVNDLGIVHGGAICTLLDVCMGTASRLHVGRPVLTLDMQTAFLSAARGTLLGEGRVVRAGRSIVFAEAELRDEAGLLIAKASGIFKPVDRSG